jgi:transposase-like protein
MSERLCRCPHCGSGAYIAVEAPYVPDRKYVCRSCGRGFSKREGEQAKRQREQEQTK